MKKLIYVLVAVVFFVLGLTFHNKNPQDVSLHYYMDWTLELPLTVLLLLIFTVGVFVGYFVSVLKSVKLRRKLSIANKTIRTMETDRV